MVEILQNIALILLIINAILLLVTQITTNKKHKKWEKQIDEDIKNLNENTEKFIEEHNN